MSFTPGPLTIRAGDYLVYEHTFGYAVFGPVSRTTASVAYTETNYARKKERRVLMRSVIFAGSQIEAEILDERLTSSQAQFNEEAGNAARRHRERNAKLIATALSNGG